jgi:hypothetical protein
MGAYSDVKNLKTLSCSKKNSVVLLFFVKVMYFCANDCIIEKFLKWHDSAGYR